MVKFTYKKKPLTKKRITKPKVSIATKLYVKRAISREVENKVWLDYGVNQSITTANATVPTNALLVPRIGQGLGKSQRTGNEIKVKYAKLTGYVNLLPYNIVTNPQVAPVIIKMWVIRSKILNGIVLANTTIATTFFDIVNSSAGFQANMLDTLLSVNKEAWQVIATKQFELGLTINTNGVADNSSFSRYFSFELSKHLGVIKYDDASLTPTNKNLYIIFQAVYPDGSTNAFVSSEYHWHYRIEYEDA